MPTLYDNFERVRQYIDQHQADVDLSSYVSYSYLESKHYLTEHQDLSSYVTKTDLSNAGYVSGAEISQMGYITSGDVSAMGYITANDISGKADKADLNSYLCVDNINTAGTKMRFRTNGLTVVTNTNAIAPKTLSYTQFNNENNPWVGGTTMKNYVDGRLAEIEASYATTADLPVIDESIIPKETGTYTLGDANHLYISSYTNRVNGPSSGLILRLGNTNKVAIYDSNMRAATANSMTLGNSSVPWLSTYSTNLYTNTAYLNDTSYTKSIVPAENNSYTLGDESHLYSATYSARLKVGNNSQIYNDGGGISLSVNSNAGIRMGSSNFYPKNNNGMNLGQSSNKWNATYTSNLYADTIHNFIWTGTSTEYAALDNYTSYQIYMIKEA